MNGENDSAGHRSTTTGELPPTNAPEPVREGFIIAPVVPTTAKIAAALAKAQGQFAEIKKNQSMAIPGRNIYRYADLVGIIKATTPALSENGIAVMQTPKMGDGAISVITRLIHESGEELTGSMSVPVSPDGRLQDLGSVITYLRRYTLTAMLNVSADDDTDGETDQAEEKSAIPKPTKLEKLGAEVRDILQIVDNAAFFDSLKGEAKNSYSHLLTNKDGHILDNDKWKDISDLDKYVDLILMDRRKDISKGAAWIKAEFAKWNKKQKGEK